MKTKKTLGERAEAPEAEALAAQALLFLAHDAAALQRFFALTGLDPADVRALAHERGFQLAVLDHIASDERLLLAFAETEGAAPESIASARRALGGGE